MGNDLRTCAGCGALLKGPEPGRGLAHSFDPRPYCLPCLRIRLPAPTPTRPVAESVRDPEPLRPRG